MYEFRDVTNIEGRDNYDGYYELNEYNQYKFKSIKYIKIDRDYIIIFPDYNKSKSDKYTTFRMPAELAEVVFDMIENNSYPELMLMFLVGNILYERTGAKKYTKFYIQEPTKKREINAPDENLKTVSQYMNNLLSAKFEGKIYKYLVRNKIDLNRNIMGYRPKLSIKDNAMIHATQIS